MKRYAVSTDGFQAQEKLTRPGKEMHQLYQLARREGRFDRYLIVRPLEFIEYTRLMLFQCRILKVHFACPEIIFLIGQRRQQRQLHQQKRPAA